MTGNTTAETVETGIFEADTRGLSAAAPLRAIAGNSSRDSLSSAPLSANDDGDGAEGDIDWPNSRP